MFRRFKGLVAGVFAGLLFAWMLVGGYVLGISNGFNHIGSSCRLAKNTIRNLQDLLAVVGLAVSALMVLGFLIAGRTQTARAIYRTVFVVHRCQFGRFHPHCDLDRVRRIAFVLLATAAVRD